MVHGRCYLAASQPGSPEARGQLQQAACLPACPSSLTPNLHSELGSCGTPAQALV